MLTAYRPGSLPSRHRRAVVHAKGPVFKRRDSHRVRSPLCRSSGERYRQYYSSKRFSHFTRLDKYAVCVSIGSHLHPGGTTTDGYANLRTLCSESLATVPVPATIVGRLRSRWGLRFRSADSTEATAACADERDYSLMWIASGHSPKHANGDGPAPGPSYAAEVAYAAGSNMCWPCATTP